MTGLRDHAVYTIKYSVLTRDRVENALGDLMQYSDAHRVERMATIVAPSEPVARAWIANRHSGNDARILSVDAVKLDGFVQDHIF